MGVFNRMSDIINSNINAILDNAEDPKKMIRLITREMEETLVHVRTQSASNMAERKHMVARIEWMKDEAENWEKKAELAINKGRDDLAKAALREKSRLDEAVAVLESDIERADDMIEKLKHDTVKLEEKLNYARARQKALVMRGRTARSHIQVKRQLHHPSHDDAMIRFEHYERRLNDMESMIEAYDLGNRTLAEEIDDLATNERLDAELAALKERVGHGNSEVQS